MCRLIPRLIGAICVGWLAGSTANAETGNIVSLSLLSQIAQASDADFEAADRENQAAEKRCFAASLDAAIAAADSSNAIELKTQEEMYWTCVKSENDLIAMKYGLPDRDLDEFFYSYMIAVGRRVDAGLITREEEAAEMLRVHEAVQAERWRRIERLRQQIRENRAQLDEIQAAKQRRQWLDLMATGLGIMIESTPPPTQAPSTTIYNLRGRTISCTRWNNVVNCF